MKGYRGYVSLILLVTLFFIVYPLQTTYAYFTDQTAINGNLKLTTGTLSLADITANSQTFHTETEHTLVTPIQNTGSLDGKLTITAIAATQNNQVIDYKNYLDVATNFNSSSINSNIEQTLSVKLTKNKDWTKEQPIVLSISVRISQANLVQDNHGFSDEKIYNITIINDKPKDENVDWPKFEGNGYVSQRLYYGVDNEKLTTIIPGVVYLKYEGKDSQKFEEKLRGTLRGASNVKYAIPTIDYIPNKGFKVTVTYPDNLQAKWNQLNSDGIQVYFQLDIPNSYEKFEFHWEETSVDTFARVMLLGTELTDTWPKIKETLNLSYTEENKLTFHSFNSWGTLKPLDRIAQLSEYEQQYFKNNLKLVASNPKAMAATFTSDYTGMILKPLTTGELGFVQLVNEKTGRVVFSRKVATNPPKTSKNVVDKPQEVTSTKESSQESSEDTIESIDETTLSTEISKSISESQSTESLEESSLNEVIHESSLIVEDDSSIEHHLQFSQTEISEEEMHSNE